MSATVISTTNEQGEHGGRLRDRIGEVSTRIGTLMLKDHAMEEYRLPLAKDGCEAFIEARKESRSLPRGREGLIGHPVRPAPEACLPASGRHGGGSGRCSRVVVSLALFRESDDIR